MGILIRSYMIFVSVVKSGLDENIFFNTINLNSGFTDNIDFISTKG